jgi:hypothetical protein
MNIKRSILLLLLLFIISLIFSLAFQNNLEIGARIVNDYFDKEAYAERGSWFSRSKIPYKETFSEYPQVATYFFALPFVFFEILIPREEIINHWDEMVHYYLIVFPLFMMIFSVLSISLLYKLRDSHKNLAFLLLLPASFYFTHNRYDILPCFLSLLSLYLLSRRQYKMSALVLSVGTFTKWYLFLLFPVFLTYYYSLHKKINWSMILTFILTSLIIILPTIIQAGVDGLVAPYKFHLSRGMNGESLFYLAHYYSKKLFDIRIDRHFTFPIFFLLQFSIVPLCITSKISSFEKVIKWSALSILTFMLFAKFYSPQWILWITPLLILIANKRSDIVWIIIFDLLTYIYFPITYDLYQRSSLFRFIILLKTILLIKFILPLFYELIKDSAIFTLAQKHFSKESRVIPF